MASPSPKPVVRLSEKIDTWVSDESTRSTRNVPTIARMPTSKGRPAATTLPNTSTVSSRTIGNARSSARSRSSSTWVVDLPEDLGEAADADRDRSPAPGIAGRQLLGRVVHGVFVAPQRGDDERLATVGAAERGRAAEVPVRDGASDSTLGPELGR